MTLSAITKQGRVITPYKMVASGGAVKAHEVYQKIEDLKHIGEKFFCLDCYYKYGKYFPVNLRKTDASKTRPHFAHPPGLSCQSKPASTESINHRTAKEFIAKHLEDSGAKVFVERRMKSGAVCRQPDVMAVFPDKVECHEVQLSKIDSNALRIRSNDLFLLAKEQHPGKNVIVNWYLSDKNQTDDNWLVFRQQEWWGYKIWFDNGIPAWELASPKIIKKIVLADAKARKERSKRKIERERWLRQQREQEQKDEAERLRRKKEEQRQRYEQEQKDEAERLRRKKEEQRQRYEQEQKWLNEERLRREQQNRTQRFAFVFWIKLWSKFNLPKTTDILLRYTEAKQRIEEKKLELLALQAKKEVRQKLLDRIAKVGYKRHDIVRGVPGRSSEHWKGKVVEVRDDGGVMVNWDGRRKHENPAVRKQPILYMLPEQIQPWFED